MGSETFRDQEGIALPYLEFRSTLTNLVSDCCSRRTAARCPTAEAAALEFKLPGTSPLLDTSA
ncbi:hypothetical protein L917_05590 [Phytophthora nicotianae]|nr:hypothetical protein L917_05590 [Phytophthora nicotianae]